MVSSFISYRIKNILDSSDLPFNLHQIQDLSTKLKDAAVGLIGVCHSRRNYISGSMITLTKRPMIDENMSKLSQQRHSYDWLSVCKRVTKIVKHLYDRDSRLSFCRPNHWLSSLANIHIDSVGII